MSVDLLQAFPREAIRATVRCGDWREAVRAAGSLLVDIGAATPTYVEAIIAGVDELGPYIVLAPGIAIAHARPDDGALSVGFSLVRLAEPLEFGSRSNDPVDLVFAFASPNHDDHITALAALADLLESGENLARIRDADDEDELHRVIEEAAT